MNNLKCKLLKALMGVSLGALGAFAVTFVIYFWNLDMKLTSVMEGILLKHYDKIDRDQHLCSNLFSARLPWQTALLRPFSQCKHL